jgi:hypothetical protein
MTKKQDGKTYRVLAHIISTVQRVHGNQNMEFARKNTTTVVKKFTSRDCLQQFLALAWVKKL